MWAHVDLQLGLYLLKGGYICGDYQLVLSAGIHHQQRDQFMIYYAPKGNHYANTQICTTTRISPLKGAAAHFPRIQQKQARLEVFWAAAITRCARFFFWLAAAKFHKWPYLLGFSPLFLRFPEIIIPQGQACRALFWRISSTICYAFHLKVAILLISPHFATVVTGGYF